MKRTLCLMLATVLLLCALSACATREKNPLLLVEYLKEKEYLTESYVGYIGEYMEFGMFASLDIDEDDEVQCIVKVRPIQKDAMNNYSIGAFFFCNDKKAAKKLQEKLADNAQKQFPHVENVVVERKNTLVFIGDETVWEGIK